MMKCLILCVVLLVATAARADTPHLSGVTVANNKVTFGITYSDATGETRYRGTDRINCLSQTWTILSTIDENGVSHHMAAIEHNVAPSSFIGHVAKMYCPSK